MFWREAYFFSDERFVESDARKEQGIYTLAPVITGKSGISHEFDFAFTKADESGDIITCSIIPSNAKDTLSLITFFNAHPEVVAIVPGYLKRITSMHGLCVPVSR